MEDVFIDDKLKTVVEKYKNSLHIVSVVLDENSWLGPALKQGLKFCSNDLVARMDTDDIAHSYRFEMQVRYMKDHPSIAVSRGMIEQFIGNVENVVGSRKLPLEHCDILKFARFRSPINHPAAIFRKSAVLAVGGYPEMYPEDYPLQCFMLFKGFLFSNMDKIILSMRGETDFQSRRGFYFFWSEVNVVKYQYKIGFISLLNVFLSLTLRLFFRILPSDVRSMVYKLK